MNIDTYALAYARKMKYIDESITKVPEKLKYEIDTGISRAILNYGYISNFHPFGKSQYLEQLYQLEIEKAVLMYTEGIYGPNIKEEERIYQRYIKLTQKY